MRIQLILGVISMPVGDDDDDDHDHDDGDDEGENDGSPAR